MIHFILKIAHIIICKLWYYKKVPLFCWFDHILDLWAEICQIFRWFFRKFKISKRHSESNWPLRDPLVSRKLLNFRRLATSVMFSISGSASETIIKDLLFPFPYLVSVSSEKTSAMSASNCSSALLINRFWRVLLASLIKVLSNVLWMTS